MNFKPHYSVDTISDIDFVGLKSLGVTCVVFDKDNTLTVPYKRGLYEPIIPAVREC